VAPTRRRSRDRPLAVLSVALTAALGTAPALALSPGGTPVYSVDVLPGDPLYRELALAAALGLVDEPPPAQEPLSRAEMHRLLGGVDARRAGAFTSRLARVQDAIAPWRRYRETGGERTLAEWHPLRSIELNGSRIRGAERAPRVLAEGSDRTEGLALERDGTLAYEEAELTFHAEGRLRADRDGVDYRALALLVRTQLGGVRVTVGREPLSWGPSAHGSALLTTNARPLDLARAEPTSPFRLPGGLRRVGAWRVTAFTGRMNDPQRADFPNPWLAGLRATLAPARWLLLGATRTAMLGGEGGPFHFGADSIWDLLTAVRENDLGSGSDTDQKASIEGTLYLWPLLRSFPYVRGGRLYAEYAGEDSPQGRPPFPSSPARLFGLELVGGPLLLRGETARNVDDTALWYSHFLYTDGYTYRGRVLGHPMGGDSRAAYVDLEATVGGWGIASAGWARVEHGFEARDGLSPKIVDPPVPHAVYDELRVRVEKFRGPFPGAIAAEVRWTDGRGDVGAFDPAERWGASLAWRQAAW
jgi:hypothetical protein